MKNKPAPVATIAGFPIAVQQTSINKFTVTYGQQTRKGRAVWPVPLSGPLLT